MDLKAEFVFQTLIVAELLLLDLYEVFQNYFEMELF